jgi:hypothetical protein
MGKAGLSVVSILVGLTAVACGATPATPAPAAPKAPTARATTLAAAIKAPEEDDARAAKAAPSEKAAPEATPKTCGAEGTLKDTSLCMPAPAYAKKLCGGIFPEVALGLFAKGTPWTRVYLAGDVEAWNASGGLTHRARLAFDEEVLVLARHGAGNGGGIVMTGAQASYDVLRWDGTCVSVMEGELTARRPPKPKPAPVRFDRLEETTRRALLAAPKVKSTHEALGKSCSSVSTPKEKKACDKADLAFSQAVVDVVRGGTDLPTPARRP